jgi:serine/threonine-protein kinase
MPQKLLNYEVLDRLGEGARSVIYAVSDPDTHQVYALKHVLRKEPKDMRFIEQMMAEYEVSKQFTHPNLRRTYDLKINKTLLRKVTEAFLIMELVDGRPLEDHPPASFTEVIETFIEAAEGLKAMHEIGYVHCDIKPNNILRGENGHVKVIDFGQSCKIGTVKERIQGTPDYIAPEQVDRRPISVQTDVFNLGATLYWALTGKNIPTRYTIDKKGENSFLLDELIPSPQDLNPKVPTPLSNLVMEMTASREKKRPADMDAVIKRLQIIQHIMEKQSQSTSEVGAAPAGPIPPSGPTP